MTTAECVAVFRGMPKRLPTAIRRGMSRAMKKVGVDAQRIAAQRGIMRSMLGGNVFGPVGGTKWKSPGKSLIQVISPRIMSDGSVVAGLRAVGVAALQELGGRTSPHLITVSKSKQAMTLKGFVHPFATSVKHPGSRVARHPFLQEAIDRNASLILREIEQAIAEESGNLGAVA